MSVEERVVESRVVVDVRERKIKLYPNQPTKNDGVAEKI